MKIGLKILHFIKTGENRIIIKYLSRKSALFQTLSFLSATGFVNGTTMAHIPGEHTLCSPFQLNI